jgi:hypothetical protein
MEHYLMTIDEEIIMSTPWRKEFLEDTIRVFQPYYDRKLTLEDAREMMDNLMGLELYLRKLRRKYKI